MRNRTKLLAILSLAALLITGCAANANQVGRIDLDTAKKAALDAAGISESEVKFHSAELDRRNGIEYYDIEFYANGMEYEYDIDALTGAVIGSKAPEADRPVSSSDKQTPAPAANGNSTADAGNNSSGSSQTAGSEISEADAKQIALDQVPGAKESDIRKFKIDYDDGRLEYEGSIYYNELEYEFEIDGYSGAIRSWEVESIYD